MVSVFDIPVRSTYMGTNSFISKFWVTLDSYNENKSVQCKVRSV